MPDRLDRHVAIKILVSEPCRGDHEVQILDRLSHGQVNHPGKKHVMQLLDHFEHTGPNGIHTCLALEVLGPSVGSTAERYQSNRFLELLLGRCRGRLCKRLHISMITTLHTEVSCLRALSRKSLFVLNADIC